jgi:hypothetical protein
VRSRSVVVSGAAIALICVISGCAGGGQAAPLPRPSSTDTPIASAQPSATTSVGQRPPTGFVPATADFPTPQDGFAWGLYPCLTNTAAFCPGLAATKDGGATWKLRTPPAGSPIDPYRRPILRFSDASDGWAAMDGLQATRDGGSTWVSAQLPGLSNPRVVAIAARPDAAFVVAADPSDRVLHLYRSIKGTTVFEAVDGVSIPSAGADVDLSIAPDDSGYLIADSLNTPHPVLYATADGGAWIPATSPCPSNARGSVSAGSKGLVAVVCDVDATGSGATKQIWVSNDRGATFEATGGPATAGFSAGIALIPPAPANTSASATSTTSGPSTPAQPTFGLVIAASALEDRLYLSPNGGRSWSVAYANSSDASGSALGLADLTFSDATHGSVILGNAGAFAKDRLAGGHSVLSPRLLVTSNGGRNWAQSVVQ